MLAKNKLRKKSSKNQRNIFFFFVQVLGFGSTKTSNRRYQWFRLCVCCKLLLPRPSLPTDCFHRSITRRLASARVISFFSARSHSECTETCCDRFDNCTLRFYIVRVAVDSHKVPRTCAESFDSWSTS